MSTLSWVVTGIVVVAAAYLTQDIWAPTVNGWIGQVPYATSTRAKVASLGSGTNY